MNCCDEYGNCDQGRDCPVRAATYAANATMIRGISNKQLGMVIVIVFTIGWILISLLGL